MTFFMILICHITSDQNLEDTWNKKVFFQQWQNKQPVVKLISQVQRQKRDSLLQKLISKDMSVIFLLKLLHCQTYDKRWLGVLPQMQCLVPQIMRWCLRQMAIHLWSMPLSRTVSLS